MRQPALVVDLLQKLFEEWSYVGMGVVENLLPRRLRKAARPCSDFLFLIKKKKTRKKGSE